ncbi:MAG: TlpA disulfide reductase family protein [Pyrinomonadaceae bacterium]
MAFRDNTKSSRGLGPKSDPIFYMLALALVLLVGSVILNVALAEKLRGANNRLSKMAAETSVAIGDALPDIEAKNLDGTSASYSYSKDRHPTVLYVFSPSCGWCEKNFENIKALSEQKGDDYRFIGISISNKNLLEYVAKQNLRFPVLMDPSPNTVLAYKLGGTPQTIVVSKEGKAVKNWNGAYMKNLQRDVENYFQVKLPGVQE